MPAPATFETFSEELTRLVAKFERELHEVKAAGYSEAKLRDDYLNLFFHALGWDLQNRAGLIQEKREVEIESRTNISGRTKRADYLFRTDGHDRFVCEAKKPREELGPRYAFQAKRYAWNMRLPLAVLTDFEEIKIYVVGGKARIGDGDLGLWKTWHFRQYPLIAREIWDLLSRDCVAGGVIDAELDKLPKKPAGGKGKAKQQWLIKPDRTRALDTDFLEFLDAARRDLASDILKHNDRAETLEGTRLNEAVQCILDRILFIRICEDRDIDTGPRLQTIVEKWRRNWDREDGAKHRQDSLRLREDSSFDMDDGGGGGGRSKLPRESLWRAVVAHFRALDRRPPSTVPFFNGNLFKQHFSEEILLGDTWLAEFIAELSDDESPYLFNVIRVEILGSVYERFLGKVVRPQGRGVTIEEKPEVRKAGGVYYTPRYIVDYIVEQTVGRQLDAIAGIGEKKEDASPAGRRASGSAGVPPAVSGVPPDTSNVENPSHRTTHEPEPRGTQTDSRRAARDAQPGRRDARATQYSAFERATRALRILDPACGSGSFLIRAFERVCEHWQRRLKHHPADRRKDLCWTDPATDDVHLTVELKRRILRDNIHGVDLDAQAVEVTQLSLYLKMLEGEDRTTLQRQRELLRDEKEIALLPPLQDNIKCGNSLIASDFSMMPEDLLRVNAFDWQTGFREIMKAGGFDAVIGNPPYIRIQTMQESDPASVAYLGDHYASAGKGNYDIYVVFVERVLGLLQSDGLLGYILPHKFFNAQYGEALRAKLASGKHLRHIVHFGDQQVFDGATTYTCLLFLSKRPIDKCTVEKVTDLQAWQTDGSASRGAVESASLSSAEWNFNVGPDALLMRRLASLPTLGSIAARMGQGIRTSANEVYVLDVVEENSRTVTAYSEILQRNVKLDRRSVLRFLQGREIKSYRLLHSGKVVIMPYRFEEGRAVLIPEREFAEIYPQTYDYLRENKTYLGNRERGRMKGSGWYGYIYPKNIDIMQAQKILVPDIADRACYALDEAGDYAFTSGYGITLKPDVKASFSFVLGLLNSRLLSFFIKRISTPMRGGFFRYFTQFIEKLPIVIPDRARHDKLVEQVDKMLALVPKLRAAKQEKERGVLQNAVDSTDRKMDDLVYELYGLTPEEIALVEGTAK